jgi:hypothetical protein
MEEKPKTSAFSNYAAGNMRAQAYPRDQFEHGAFMLDTDNRQEEPSKMGKFSALVDRNVLLSNIGNDVLMRYYQNDIIFLTHLFSMAEREEAVQIVFEVLYYGWKHELALTRTKGGAERKHQAQIATNYQPKENLGGYGAGLNLGMEEKGDEDVNFIKKLFKKKR